MKNALARLNGILCTVKKESAVNLSTALKANQAEVSRGGENWREKEGGLSDLGTIL